MSTRRPGRPPADDAIWVPPPWHARPEVEPPPPVEPHRPSRRAARPPEPQLARRDPSGRVVLGIAVAQGVTGALALATTFVGLLIGPNPLPAALLLVVVVQAVGYLIARGDDTRAMAHSWLLNAAVTVVVLPVAALQAALAREPYVAVSRGTATPLILASVGLGVLLVLLALAAAIASWPAPEQAALLYMPAPLLIPAAIGAREDLGEVESLRTLAQAMLIAAAASLLAWSLPRASRALMPPAAMAIQILALWASGRGPSFQEASGRIVPLLYAALLALSVVLVVAVPVIAFRCRRMIHLADLVEGHPTPDPM